MDGDKRRGEACVCARHTWLERHIDRLCRKEGAGGPTHTMGERPKVKRRICAMELENAEGG